MSVTTIRHTFESFSLVRHLKEQLQNDNREVLIPTLEGSALSFVIENIFQTTNKHLLLILRDKETASYHLNDLEPLISSDDLLFFPASYRRPYEIEETDNANVLLRTTVLNRINSRQKKALIITYPEALFEKVVSKSGLNRYNIRLHTGKNYDLDTLIEKLFDLGFDKKGFVSQPGEFSLRGGILDVFSFSRDEPYRLEFSDDILLSVRIFDPETQLSSSKERYALITPDILKTGWEEKKQSLPQYLGDKCLIWIEDLDFTRHTLNRMFDEALHSYNNLPESPLSQSPPLQLYLNGDKFSEDLQNLSLIHSSSQGASNGNTSKILPQPVFDKNFELFFEDARNKTAEGYSLYLFCDNDKQAERLNSILAEKEHINYKTLVYPLYRGFIIPELKLACYTDHQLFGRYHKFRLKRGFHKKQALSLQELTGLQKGDYIVHIDHGIGVFGGLQKIDVEGKMQEAVKLIYADRDILYLNIHSLHKISKYNGKDGKEPKIYKLGSPAWKKLKQKTKTRVKKMAFDLLKLYAKRMMKQGFAYAPDSWLQYELEASFIYEDTPDQLKATQEVKTDMESSRPMDRLICGDVGFGKTEVAIRAAFKAVDNGKQVAVLVPTTLLAFQHYRSFSERLENFPVRVDYLSRFRSTKQRNQILKDLNEGKIDILIGTHQLVSDKITFKDLGLLIIDEEQKFGVNIKDKLKTLRVNVDTLTLTATPIPRTLQFSLMSARDMSLITTPPPNRHPVETHVIRFQPEIIRDAIQYELTRNGQIFFIHNRVENIREVAGMLQRLLPDVKIGIGHGQMDGKKLERLMLDFMQHKFDILVSTTIVENGLDVPNANTIFIHNAHQFGLSDLHQMRGRVGRSNKKAFCYMITPPITHLNPEAQKRMRAIQTYTELGSGFQIAMKDLEIRGAGDLLGAEQSGFINDLGFDTYRKILEEAVEELKEQEFKHLYDGTSGTPPPVKEAILETDLELLIPDDYVPDLHERLRLYQKLSTLSDENSLNTLASELTDRFGALPPQVSGLWDSVRLKWLAACVGWEKIVLKKGVMIGYFTTREDSGYYDSPIFMKVLEYARQHPENCRIKEKTGKKGNRLLLRLENINSMERALTALREMTMEDCISKE